jgi:YesN/AraC family two-component response regulator
MLLPCYDLTLLLSGNLVYEIDGKEIVLQSGDAILVPPGAVRMRHAATESTDYISFNFTTERELALPAHLEHVLHGDALFLLSAFDKINVRSYLDHKEENEHLLACLLLVLENRIRSRSIHPLVRTIMKYVHEHLSERIMLEDIGRETFFSPIYCDALFKKETGRSIIDYVIEKRIDEAKRLLLGEEIPLAVIAEQLGFRDYNYFSRAFKKRCGYTPSAYRRLWLK